VVANGPCRDRHHDIGFFFCWIRPRKLDEKRRFQREEEEKREIAFRRAPRRIQRGCRRDTDRLHHIAALLDRCLRLFLGSGGLGEFGFSIRGRDATNAVIVRTGTSGAAKRRNSEQKGDTQAHRLASMRCPQGIGKRPQSKGYSWSKAN